MIHIIGTSHIAKQSLDEIKSATEAMNQVWQEAAQQMYAQTTSQQAGDPGAGEAQAEPESGDKSKDAQDADFEVVDEEK